MVREAIQKKKGGEIVAEAQTQEDWMADQEQRIVDLEGDLAEVRTKVDRVRTIKAGFARPLKVKLFFGLIEIER